MANYSTMSDEQLDKALEEKYGYDWDMNDLNPEEEPDREFLARLETGVGY